MAEDIPATPGWVEERIDEIVTRQELGPAAECRSAYLACLASCRSAVMDAQAGHDDCRHRFLACLREHGIPAKTLAGLEQALEAMEAEISERT